jgi:hypothetical protein
MNRKACPGFRFSIRATKRRKRKGSRTPADARFVARTQAACGTRHGERRLAPPSACGRARLPAFHCGSHQRDFRPEGSASGQASRKATERSGHSRTRRLFGHSEAPRAPVIVPAGMMPEPPGCGVYPSARGRRTRSAFGEYPPRRRPLRARLAAVIAIAAVKSNGAEFSSTNRAFRATRLFCKGAALQ